MTSRVSLTSTGIETARSAAAQLFQTSKFETGSSVHGRQRSWIVAHVIGYTKLSYSCSTLSKLISSPSSSTIKPCPPLPDLFFNFLPLFLPILEDLLDVSYKSLPSELLALASTTYFMSRVIAGIGREVGKETWTFCYSLDLG